jgi:hypothetical protein
MGVMFTNLANELGHNLVGSRPSCFIAMGWILMTSPANFHWVHKNFSASRVWFLKDIRYIIVPTLIIIEYPSSQNWINIISWRFHTHAHIYIYHTHTYIYISRMYIYIYHTHILYIIHIFFKIISLSMGLNPHFTPCGEPPYVPRTTERRLRRVPRACGAWKPRRCTGDGGSGSLPAMEVVPQNGAGPTPHGALENQRTKWWICPLPKLDYRRVVI